MKKKIFTSIGLMSGTSMDGVDLSVIKSDGNDQFSSIYDTYKEFDDGLYNQLISLRDKYEFAFIAIGQIKSPRLRINLFNPLSMVFIIPSSEDE